MYIILIHGNLYTYQECRASCHHTRSSHPQGGCRMPQIDRHHCHCEGTTAKMRREERVQRGRWTRESNVENVKLINNFNKLKYFMLFNQLDLLQGFLNCYSWRPKFQHQNLTRPEIETNVNFPKLVIGGACWASQSLSKFFFFYPHSAK